MKSNKFLDEIYEQPATLQNTLEFYLDGDGKKDLSKAVSFWKSKKPGQIIFTGMGSSFFISGMASGILNGFGIQSQAINAGELIHYLFPLVSSGSIVICISQSGESFEIIKFLQKRTGNVTCIGICNEPQSYLGRNADMVLLSQAGEELMTSTKTFTATAMVAAIYALSISDKWTSLQVSQLRSMILDVSHLISDSAWLSGAMNLLENAVYIQLLARGPSMAAAQQGALMFMEGAVIPASALLSGEFRHGPMEMVDKGFVSIILAPDGETYLQHVKLAEDITHFGGSVVFISNRSPRALPSGAFYIPVPCQNESLFSIPAIIPLQLMVNQCAVKKGRIPGNFVRGAKITKTE